MFKRNPIKYLGNLLGIQLRADRFNIAKTIDDQYFDHKKSFEEQLDELEKVFKLYLFKLRVLVPYISLEINIIFNLNY